MFVSFSVLPVLSQTGRVSGSVKGSETRRGFSLKTLRLTDPETNWPLVQPGDSTRPGFPSQACPVLTHRTEAPTWAHCGQCQDHRP